MRTRHRRAAWVVLALASGALTWSGVSAYRARSRHALFRPPFSAAGAVAVDPDGGAVKLAPDDSSAAVVLYVRWSCVHCDAEIRRWAEVLGGGGKWARLRLRVVAAEPLPRSGGLPSAIARRVLLDADGSAARALGVSVVPTTAYVRGATVVDVARGETSVGDIRRRVARLLGQEAGRER